MSGSRDPGTYSGNVTSYLNPHAVIGTATTVVAQDGASAIVTVNITQQTTEFATVPLQLVFDVTFDSVNQSTTTTIASASNGYNAQIGGCGITFGSGTLTGQASFVDESVNYGRILNFTGSL